MERRRQVDGGRVEALAHLDTALQDLPRHFDIFQEP